MNIFKLGRKKEETKYAGSSRRSSAAMIDMWIVLTLRVIVMQILGTLWLNYEIVKFMDAFKEKFGTESVKNTREHIDFVLQSPIFYYSLFFYFIILMIGAFYHAYLNSSAWKATIGKRLLKIVMVKENEQPLSMKRAFGHYFLSILPFAYIFYLVNYQLRHELTFYQTVTASETNLFFGIVFVLWVQIHLFTKRKTTAYDLICNTVQLNGRTGAKFPWSKNEN